MNNSNKKYTCIGCVYSRLKDSNLYCVKNAPSPRIVSVEEDHCVCWPTVAKNCWCGEFEDMED